ncbi:CAMK family protein kinase [Histomonas meleagridis]|uniref:CAMK family protein kinase n=1 Tax=Histomonas meleagridis TaxID=135588 RepID=UPI003559AFB7|nr:CAMK family protein kinase [Histomonas meleagridis]KAH0798846.1 CAMK family protein kinase [Histomonas meleagridis]
MQVKPKMISSLKQTKLQVHDYYIGDRIGSGSFAQIRVAFHKRSNNPFAVKIISKVKLQNSKHGKHLLFNETILAPILDHPAIIEVIEIADSHSQFFQFMRFADQGDLCRLLRKSPIEHNVAIRIADQILSAVEYLHSYGICHRDIKLENILMSRSTGPKLCDFGLASITFDGKVHGNRGSFEYSAPEAISTPEFDGFKADMWSVGVVLYALFARRLPYLKVCKDYDFSAHQVDYSSIPPIFVPLISKLLSINPADRPSATEARGFAALRSSQRRKKEPLSAVVEPNLEAPEATILMSKLSQVLGVPFDSFLAQLRSPLPNREKLFYSLYQKKYEKYNLNALNDPYKVNVSTSTMPARTQESTYQCQAFPVSAFTLYQKMHQYLMKQRCCVSSPISKTPVIVQRKEEESTDVRIKFGCYDKKDAENDQPNSLLVLDAKEDPSLGVVLLDDIMSYMKKSFLVPQPCA